MTLKWSLSGSRLNTSPCFRAWGWSLGRVTFSLSLRWVRKQGLLWICGKKINHLHAVLCWENIEIKNKFAILIISQHEQVGVDKNPSSLKTRDYFDGLVQDCSNSISNVLESLQSWAKPSICPIKEISWLLMDLAKQGTRTSAANASRGIDLVLSWNIAASAPWQMDHGWNF